jgi:hypothetical protein
MSNQLTFEVACGRRILGGVTVSRGKATARIGEDCVRGVPLGHALMWVREHNPYPEDVEFRLIASDKPTGPLYARIDS